MSSEEFNLLSRGDRVRGRLCKPRGPGPHPVVVALGVESRLPETLLSVAPTGFAVVAFDLPLCGSRSSGKMSPQVLQRLSGDLADQARADVEALLAYLARDPELDLAKLTLIGVGRAAELLRGLESDRRFAKVVLDATAPSINPGWLG